MMRAIVLLASLALTTILASCDNGARQPSPTLLPQSSPTIAEIMSYPTATTDPNTKPAYQLVRDAFRSGRSQELVGTTISGWRGWVVRKAWGKADQYGGRKPFWIELVIDNPYKEDLLHTIPWDTRVQGTPAVATAVSKIAMRQSEEVYLTIENLTEAKYRELSYGREITVGGTIKEINSERGFKVGNATLLAIPTFTPTIPPAIEELVITFNRGTCFGYCPSYNLTITGNGVVTYEGQAYVDVCGIQTSTISRREIGELLAIFDAIDFNSLRDEYLEINEHDASYVYTALTLGGKTKEVTHYYGDISSPTKLSILEDRIDEIVNSNQWVRMAGNEWGNIVACDRPPSPTSKP